MAKRKLDADWVFPVVVLIVLLGFLWIAAEPTSTVEPPSDDQTSRVFTIEPPYDFEEIFTEVRRIDQRYGTDFRNESLNEGPILNEGAATEYIALLDRLREEIANETVAEEDKYIRFFLDAREHQVRSEIYFQRAMAYGERGIYRGPSSCADENTIIRATVLYNRSRHHGGKALLNYDRALAYKPAWPLIGVNEYKPAFYDKIFKQIGELVKINTQGINRFCGEVLPKIQNTTLKRTSSTA